MSSPFKMPGDELGPCPCGHRYAMCHRVNAQRYCPPLASEASAAEGRSPNTAESSFAGVGEARPAEPPTEELSQCEANLARAEQSKLALAQMWHDSQAENQRLREQLDAATDGLELIANGGYGDASIKARAALKATGEVQTEN